MPLARDGAQLSLPVVPNRGIGSPTSCRAETFSRGTPRCRCRPCCRRGPASTQNAGAASSSTRVPPASTAALIRSCATSWGTLTSRCQRWRSGASESVSWNQTLGVRSARSVTSSSPAPRSRGSPPRTAGSSRGRACPARARCTSGRVRAGADAGRLGQLADLRARRRSRWVIASTSWLRQGDGQVRVAQVHVGMVVGLVGGLGDLRDQRRAGVEVTGLEPDHELVQHLAPAVEPGVVDLLPPERGLVVGRPCVAHGPYICTGP